MELLRQFLVPFFPAHYNDSSMPAAATWPKGAKLARILSLSIWHLNPLAKPSAVVLGWLQICHVVRLLIAWEGAASSGHHFTLTPVWFRGMRAHAEQDPRTNPPGDPEHMLHLLLKGVVSSEPLCLLFFFPPLSPSSSPSHICVQPLEGPTSCHAFHMCRRFPLWTRNTKHSLFVYNEISYFTVLI